MLKEASKLFAEINKAKLSQRDKFILYLLGMLVLLMNSISGLVFVKQLPDLLELIINNILKTF